MLEDQIMKEMKTAMLARDDKSLRALRAVKAEIIIAKTAEGSGGKVSEEQEMKLLQKLVKKGKDSLEIYEKQNRPDLAQKEREEIAVIEKFLPKQMDDSEIRNVITEIVKESGASSPADMGRVMGIANKQLGGKADGKTISEIVKEILSGSNT